MIVEADYACLHQQPINILSVYKNMIKGLIYSGSIFFFLYIGSAKAQYSYGIADDIIFRQHSQELSFPMVGGMNSPIFTQFDLNMDKKMDIVVFEKNGNLIHPFINVGDSNEINYSYNASYMDKFPENLEYWIASADYNCDGKMDLFIYSPSAMMSYENISSNNTGFQFGNPQKLSFPSAGFQFNILASRIDKPSFYDVDVDGDLDILVFGEPQIYYYKNMSMENSNTCGLEFERKSRCWGKITEGAVSSSIYLDTCVFGEYPDAERKKTKHSGSSITALDVDGNLTTDVLVGDVSMNNLSLLVNGDQTSDRTSSHIISLDTAFPSYDTSVNLLSFPAAYHMDVNNDNLKDLIVSSFNNDRFEMVATEKNVHFYKNTSNSVNPRFRLQQKDFLLEDMIDIGRGAHPVFYDQNKDGLMDIIAGNLGSYHSDSNKYVGKLFYFENTGTSTTPEFTLIDEDYAGVSSIKLHGKNGTAMALYPAFADLDADGKSEMMLGDELGRLHLFTDTSTLPNTSSFALVQANFDNIDLYRYSTPQFYDLNKDGLMDLLVGMENGRIRYYTNLGTSTDPIFNLDVDSVIFIKNNEVRYYIDKNHPISRLKVGDKLTFYGKDKFINSGIKEVLLIDPNNKYVDVFSPYVNSQNYINEYASDKKAFYGSDSLGGINIRNRYVLNGNPTPLFYDFEGKTQLLSGSKIGTIYHYSNIDNRLDSNFSLTDSNFLSQDFGNMVFLSGADINNDNKLDLILGNEAGGFKIYYAKGYLSDGSISKSKGNLMRLYPNPSRESFNIELGKENSNSEYHIHISNMLGQIMHQSLTKGNKIQISTLNWPNGIYLINVFNASNKSVGKIVVKH